jgi:hypothetical protein
MLNALCRRAFPDAQNFPRTPDLSSSKALDFYPLCGADRHHGEARQKYEWRL